MSISLPTRFIAVPAAAHVRSAARIAVLAMALLATVWTWGQTGNGSLDETDTRAVTKANFLFHFAASNEWPETVKEGEFHLTIIGNERLYAELVDKYAMKLIGAQPLHIHGYPDPEAWPKDAFHHLVYCEPGGDGLKGVSEALQNTPTVLVSDAPDGLAQGSLINFVAIGNRIRYEINAEEAAKKGVLIGNKIMSWAVKSTP